MSEVTTQVENGVLVMTINRPEAKNAVNRAVAEAMAAAMDELDANDDLRVGILTGAGGTFCSGMDLKAFLTGELPMVKGKGFAGFGRIPAQEAADRRGRWLCAGGRDGARDHLRSARRQRQGAVRHP
jgi:enoyl-CoA hydratase